MYRSPIGRTFAHTSDALRDCLFTHPTVVTEYCRDLVSFFRWAQLSEKDIADSHLIKALVEDILHGARYVRVDD